MIAQFPTTVKDRKEAMRQALRLAMQAELDAVSTYEQLAAISDGVVKKAFLDIAKEEKTHVGEFEALLLQLDKEQADELKKGAEEIAEMSD
jgi:rubrerythrin